MVPINLSEDGRTERVYGFLVSTNYFSTLGLEPLDRLPALQKLLLKGWVRANWTVSDSGRRVRSYRVTRSGRRQLDLELAEYRRMNRAIEALLESA